MNVVNLLKSRLLSSTQAHIYATILTKHLTDVKLQGKSERRKKKKLQGKSTYLAQKLCSKREYTCHIKLSD